MSSPYLTPAEVAAMLKVSPKTIYRWSLTDSTMPVVRLGPGGHVVRFPREKLMSWLERKEPRLARRAGARDHGGREEAERKA